MARMRSSLSGISLHAAVLLKRFKGSGDLACGQQFDGGFKSRVFLPHDFIELGSAHPSLLQLLEWTARFDALMLPGVADEEHPIAGTEPSKEFTHLVGAGEARFIDKVEMPPVGDGIGLGRARKKALQSSRLDPGLAKLARCPRSGGEALHFIALCFDRAAQRRQHSRFPGAGVALDALNAVGRAEHIFDHALLSAIQMRMLVGNLDGLGAGQ